MDETAVLARCTDVSFLGPSLPQLVGSCILFLKMKKATANRNSGFKSKTNKEALLACAAKAWGFSCLINGRL